MDHDLTPEEYLKSILAADQAQENCPMRRTLNLLSGKWRTHVLYALCRQPSCRFSDLKKAVPHITNTMLSSTLRDLEALGVISRTQFNEIPPHVEYALTEKGRALLPVFCEMARWGNTYLNDDGG